MKSIRTYEEYKVILKYIKQDLNKEKDIPYFRILCAFLSRYYINLIDY